MLRQICPGCRQEVLYGPSGPVHWTGTPLCQDGASGPAEPISGNPETLLTADQIVLILEARFIVGRYIVGTGGGKVRAVPTR